MNATKLFLMTSLALAAATGCDRAEGTQPDSQSNKTQAAENLSNKEMANLPNNIQERLVDPGQVEVVDNGIRNDNTGKNDRDRDPAALTPGDQAENETDLTITQKIRQAVVAKDAFSMSAKNVKIITNGQVVTLRGPVKSEKEKADIAAIAQGIPGVKRVDNQLEVNAD